ncbi:hypothetical protein U1Q18_040398, partial [Sarracenia purpurea var. burkii]
KFIVSSSSTISSEWNSGDERLINGVNRYFNRHREEDDEGGERKVNCVVEVISWRERRVRAQIFVNADIESVWNALTDYERLADFIPNLVCR